MSRIDCLSILSVNFIHVYISYAEKMSSGGLEVVQYTKVVDLT